MHTRDAVVQEIIAHEAIYNQFCDGLEGLHILQLIRVFPEMFLPLARDVDSSEVVEALFVHEDTHLSSGDEVVLGYLKRFIHESTEEGILLC